MHGPDCCTGMRSPQICVGSFFRFCFISYSPLLCVGAVAFSFYQRAFTIAAFVVNHLLLFVFVTVDGWINTTELVNLVVSPHSWLAQTLTLCYWPPLDSPRSCFRLSHRIPWAPPLLLPTGYLEPVQHCSTSRFGRFIHVSICMWRRYGCLQLAAMFWLGRLVKLLSIFIAFLWFCLITVIALVRLRIESSMVRLALTVAVLVKRSTGWGGSQKRK